MYNCIVQCKLCCVLSSIRFKFVESLLIFQLQETNITVLILVKLSGLLFVLAMHIQFQTLDTFCLIHQMHVIKALKIAEFSAGRQQSCSAEIASINLFCEHAACQWRFLCSHVTKVRCHRNLRYGHESRNTKPAETLKSANNQNPLSFPRALFFCNKVIIKTRAYTVPSLEEILFLTSISHALPKSAEMCPLVSLFHLSEKRVFVICVDRSNKIAVTLKGSILLVVHADI